MRKSRHVRGESCTRSPTYGEALLSPWSGRQRVSLSHSLRAITNGTQSKPLCSPWSGRQGGLRFNFFRQQPRGGPWSCTRGNGRRREDKCQTALRWQKTVVYCVARLCYVIRMLRKALSAQQVVMRTADCAVCFSAPLTCQAGTVSLVMERRLYGNRS